MFRPRLVWTTEFLGATERFLMLRTPTRLVAGDPEQVRKFRMPIQLETLAPFLKGRGRRSGWAPELKLDIKIYLYIY